MTEKIKNKSILKKTLITFGIIFGIFIIAGLFNFDRIQRLYRVINLFNQDVIVQNFRTMGDKFDSRTIHHGPDVFTFKKEIRKLPDEYIFNGQKRSVNAFIEHSGTTGLIVIKDDTILFEKYYRGNTESSKAISWSVAKSFVSAMFGIAVSEGYIKDINQPVTDYLPSLKNSGYNGVSIKNVLQMSSGVRFNEDYGDFNSDINRMGRYFALNMPFADFVASLKAEKKPGTFHHYVSMDTQVLGMILREATGKNLSEYAQEKLWKPLGMESDAYWLTDSSGMEAAFGGLNVTLRDYARFGRLYLNKGNWNGKQIVPEVWCKASVTPDAHHLMPGKRPDASWVLGYGYQWWIPENPDGDYLAIGIYGQAIYVYPRYNIVIAKTSAYDDYNKDGFDMEIESIEMFRAIARDLGR
jgi:CubicO group peptidase (beta-lactamase class C family)